MTLFHKGKINLLAGSGILQFYV
uniref:Uncharacterized protein n=1 Tax=Anguilla anguilla TaxID=7936 RepID=A0A0E9TZP3_ANGAN